MEKMMNNFIMVAFTREKIFLIRGLMSTGEENISYTSIDEKIKKTWHMFFSLKINQDTSFRGWTRIIHPNLQKDTENTSAWLKTLEMPSTQARLR
jgi:hypothetical protein